MKHRLCGAEELQPGELRPFQVGPRSIVLARTGDGSYRALRNICSHQGAPLHAGRLIDEVNGERAGSFEVTAPHAVLRCPWHGYEFSAETGRCLADPARERVRTYPVTIEDATVVVEV